MPFTFAADSILRGFAERRIFPVATVLNAIPSAGATRASSPSSVPIHRTSSVLPAAVRRPCKVRIAVRAG
ncbi:hypothetical protein VR46_39730 [Streptomyces sp. NRRL S-444]|nr:hypothetical protein VR46_39730 [Streptomyces sp. NRRL S-444]